MFVLNFFFNFYVINWNDLTFINTNHRHAYQVLLLLIISDYYVFCFIIVNYIYWSVASIIHFLFNLNKIWLYFYLLYASFAVILVSFIFYVTFGTRSDSSRLISALCWGGHLNASVPWVLVSIISLNVRGIHGCGKIVWELLISCLYCWKKTTLKFPFFFFSVNTSHQVHQFLCV